MKVKTSTFRLGFRYAGVVTAVHNPRWHPPRADGTAASSAPKYLTNLRSPAHCPDDANATERAKAVCEVQAFFVNELHVQPSGPDGRGGGGGAAAPASLSATPLLNLATLHKRVPLLDPPCSEARCRSYCAARNSA